VIVNLDKKEFIHPHKLASGLKFWEILASESACRVLGFLLRKSNEGGGGDFDGKTYEEDKRSFCGRWQGDRIAIIGDYDASKIYDKCIDLDGMARHNEWVTKNNRVDEVLTKQDLFKDISDRVLVAYNAFIEIPELQVNMTTSGWRENNKKSETPKGCPDMAIRSSS